MGRRGRRRNLPRKKILKRPKIWGGDQPEPENTSATGGCVAELSPLSPPRFKLQKRFIENLMFCFRFDDFDDAIDEAIEEDIRDLCSGTYSAKKQQSETGKSFIQTVTVDPAACLEWWPCWTMDATAKLFAASQVSLQRFVLWLAPSMFPSSLIS